MKRAFRPLTLVIFAIFTGLACGSALVANGVIRDQGDRLLRERAVEVGALLTNSLSGATASLQSLSPLQPRDNADAIARFSSDAAPLIQGETRALVLARVEHGAIERMATVGDGVPAGDIMGDRAALMRRAVAEPGLVTGIVTDGVRRRTGVAIGPGDGADGWVVYQESAIDPHYPHPTTHTEPFGELDVAMYAGPHARSNNLIIATGRAITPGHGTATVNVPVGVDQWLVVVRNRQPLVGSFAGRVPWFLLFGGMVSAALAAVAVEAIARRRDYALTLVAERTATLQSSVRELEAAQAELIDHAYHDALTRLANRTLFLDRLSQALRRAERSPALNAVMFIDLDRFKWVNDSMGHEVGDHLLVATAQRLTATVRPGDTVARLGGDEFVVLCEGLADENEPLAVARRLHDVLSAPFDVDGRQIRMTVSIGVAVASREGAEAEALLHDSDLAMYRAKERGRDRVELFDEPLRLRATERIEIETALRRAVEDHQFTVEFQPVVDLSCGSVRGVEALVRWHDPALGSVPPTTFIPLAEDVGLIAAIGYDVLREACRQVAAWNRARPDQPPLNVSVNLSARQLAVNNLADTVADVLTRAGLNPELLWLEITESTLMADAESTRSALQSLKALGVTLVVDDFGTGYSSLLYLRRFPMDVLKVDQSFVAGLGRSAEDTAIVVGVVRLAQALGLKAVAEGVETVEQETQLLMLGCNLAQGFRWSPAQSADAMFNWIERFRSERAAHRAPLPTVKSALVGVPIRVIIVDDQSSMRELMRLAMALDGNFDIVAEASNGADAIELARAYQPDLVLLDLAMPTLDGVEAMPRIREVAPNTKIVVLTGTDASFSDPSSMQAASAFFDKGHDLNDVVARLPALIGH